MTLVLKNNEEIEPGQIRYLYFWVHPQWRAPICVDREIKEHKDFIDKLLESPRAGLVQIADSIGHNFREDKNYSNFIRELSLFGDYAKDKLRCRYLVGDKTRFFDARKQEHINTLIKNFSLIQNNQERFVLDTERGMTKEPKYLAKISIYGKEVDSCPLGQATLLGLEDITSIIRYHPHETPNGITPPRKNNPFPGDGDAEYIFSKSAKRF